MTAPELLGSYLPLDQAAESAPPWPAWVIPESKTFTLGVDVGQVNDPTAIVVARAESKCTRDADWLSNKPPEYETREDGRLPFAYTDPYGRAAEAAADTCGGA